MKKDGVDLEKEMQIIERKLKFLKKEGIINQGQIDIIGGQFTTKEALDEINKEFERRYYSN